ncbi:integrase family protein [Rhodocyclus purpureus]|uniref:integrase family protein n=1 Tax=Rhodocyclus purpureus TaxID=1067 RepID=UPI0019143994|nr:integrase family protein [Rhodocyclus purpureus]MBK5913488.1 preprotein translocase [Rhodocyclus purpureus]
MGKRADTERRKLTIQRIKSMEPPTGKQARYVYDEDPRCLCIRITPAGAKSFVFAAKLNTIPIRVTIGSVDAWLLDAAREEARRLQVMVDQGIDPRQEKADRIAAAEAKKAAAVAAKLEAERMSAPALDAWSAYIEARRGKWGGLMLRDHERVSAEGGKPITRGRKTTDDGTTQAGALRPLLALPLREIDADRVQAWLAGEAAKRPTHAALAFRLLRGFLNWCAEQPVFADQVQTGACAAKAVREELPKRQAKDDCLQREMLRPWFEQVRAISNPVHSAYLQVALLTGARREEVAGLRWEDVDFQWKALTIGDKLEGERTIPLTPYVAGLLLELKRINDTPPPEWRVLHGKRIKNDLDAWEPSPWVFASPTAESGRLQEPRIAHKRALAAAGLPSDMTIHGLRRSFGTLSEWCQVPTGVVAQIMGHKPSATAEKHYRIRPLDLLRMWHERIENWILTEAGIKPRPAPEIGKPALAVA